MGWLAFFWSWVLNRVTSGTVTGGPPSYTVTGGPASYTVTGGPASYTTQLYED